MRKLSILYVLCFLACSVYGQRKALIEYVSDGDTFYVRMLSGEKERVRLAEVDCPEKNQEYGLEVKELVSRILLKGDTVELDIRSKDRYGRLIAALRFDDQQDLATYLVANGLAWHYKQYSDNKDLAALEVQAKKSGAGLWKNQDAIAPWEFRRQ